MDLKTIEYRLVKYRNADQFEDCLTFCKYLTNKLYEASREDANSENLINLTERYFNKLKNKRTQIISDRQPVRLSTLTFKEQLALFRGD